MNLNKEIATIICFQIKPSWDSRDSPYFWDPLVRVGSWSLFSWIKREFLLQLRPGTDGGPGRKWNFSQWIFAKLGNTSILRSLVSFCSLGQIFEILFLSDPRARKHGYPNGGRAHLLRGKLRGLWISGCWSRNPCSVDHHILCEDEKQWSWV